MYGASRGWVDFTNFEKIYFKRETPDESASHFIPPRNSTNRIPVLWEIL
jgi:hypothetical protein